MCATQRLLSAVLQLLAACRHIECALPGHGVCGAELELASAPPPSRSHCYVRVRHTHGPATQAV
jgi:hypothetical protein